MINIKNPTVIVKQSKCISALKESCKNKPFLKILEILEIREILKNSALKLTIGLLIDIVKKKDK